METLIAALVLFGVVAYSSDSDSPGENEQSQWESTHTLTTQNQISYKDGQYLITRQTYEVTPKTPVNASHVVLDEPNNGNRVAGEKRGQRAYAQYSTENCPPVMEHRVFFGYDSASIMPEVGRELEVFTKTVSQCDIKSVEVAGHASTPERLEGHIPHNIELANARSIAVIDRFSKLSGMPKSKIINRTHDSTVFQADKYALISIRTSIE